MGEPTKIQGTCNERFERVRGVFTNAFKEGLEVGAAVSIVVDGERVVDLWSGWMDAGRTRPWQRDTIVNVFSTTKGMTALCAHRLVEEGRLDLEAPVAKYWPEFAAAGKESITVRQLISHQAGLPAIRKTLAPADIYDWDTMVEALAELEPWWEPGSGHGYHALTFGWLVGEVVRRITGKSLGTYFRETFAEPLAADFYIGFGEELDDRVADLIQGPMHFNPDEPSFIEAILNDPQGMTAKAFANPNVFGDVPMSREWRAAEIPAANGHASAAGIATLYGALAAGELLGPDAIECARQEQVCGPDLVIPLVTKIANGFMLTPDQEPCGRNPKAFNHAGAGGSLGYCDPEARMGLGYTMNNMHMGAWLIDPRARALVDAVYEGL
ncbi:MAG: class A beta-lactamase-related serine hydrolase [Deltaproteobacteria bacterium]|nr:beta-lactamase family protein [Myxococcales bacterium]TDJ12425.1 MAG: class A beta-lactamase-related serine hydrolase [Deltaproteobacteria bacterium]